MPFPQSFLHICVASMPQFGRYTVTPAESSNTKGNRERICAHGRLERHAFRPTPPVDVCGRSPRRLFRVPPCRFLQCVSQGTEEEHEDPIAGDEQVSSMIVLLSLHRHEKPHHLIPKAP